MRTNILVKIFLLVGIGLLAFIYLMGLFSSIHGVTYFPRVPRQVTLAQAVAMDVQKKETGFLSFSKPLYVEITDAVWQCASIERRSAGRGRKFTNGVFTDSANTAVFFVQMHGHHNCGELNEQNIIGVIQSHTRRPITYQSDTDGLIEIDEKTDRKVLSLCAKCTRTDDQFALAFFLAFPFIMWQIVRFGNRQRKRQEATPRS